MRAAPRVARVAVETFLTVLAVLGAVCILLVGAAAFFNVTLIMFKTGSMSPTIPAGSVAVVREIPAADVQVGDVVTVDRSGQLPITHRVTSVAAGPTAGHRVITMKGDANQAEDPAPYTVSTVRIVMFSVPGMARVIGAMSNPYVLGAITIGASLIVTWAFWPRSVRGSSRSDEAAESADAQESAPRRAKSEITVVIALAVAGAMGMASVQVQPAVAAEVEVVRGDHLTLTSISDPGMRSMSPGAVVPWQVGVVVDADEPGTIVVSLSGTGDSSLELSAEVRVCSREWRDGTCPGEVWELPSLKPLPIDGAESELLEWGSDEERWFLFTVSMPDTASPRAEGSVTQVVHAVGSGETVTVGDDTIADTGAPDLRLPLVLAALAIAAGVLLARAGAWRASWSKQGTE